ncbi:MAG: hypothetical protein P8P19_05860 [Polaribacter sp.]|nr:hypothetical protein [Polaribacter sp.]
MKNGVYLHPQLEIILGFLLLQSNVSMGQWTADLAGMVKKEETKKRMDGATITIKKNGSVWKTITADAKGYFDVPLLPGAVYIVEVSKPMHVTKRIEIDTRNVPAEDAKFGFDVKFDVSLFEKMEGLDVSILKQPIGKFKFNEDFGAITSDAAYAKSIKAELDRLKSELAARLKAEEENRKKNQKFYDAAIVAADKAFNAGKYEEAKPFYEKAAKIFPTETYPEFQLGDISDKLMEQAEANKRYKSTILKADAAFKAREWEKATSAYEHAAYLKENEQYPKDKIKEVKAIIANEKKAEKEYAETIAAADQFLTAKEYEKAKGSYKKASELKTYEQYPKDKLTEIEGILAEIAKKKAEEKARNEKYNALVAAADAMLGSKKYDLAKGKYNEALGVKSEEQYPKDKLTEIEGILAEIARKEAERKAKEAQFKALIAEADKLLGTKDYSGSKAKYTEALGVKSEEQYPKDQLKEIDRILAEIAKKEAEEKAKDEKYQNLIVAADGLLGAKDYDESKAKYNEALGLKPAEQYPKDKIKEIDGILAEIAKREAAEKAKEAKYKGLIATADKMLSTKNYAGAKAKYTEALGVKSEEQYPKDKLTEIEGLLAELARKEAERKAAEALEKKYQGLITAADGMMSSKNYEGAKGKYNEALGVKSGEQYPKDKLSEIEGILAEIARKEAERKAAEALEKKYQGLITTADGMMSSKNYEGAKGKYNEALGVKSGEQYPKDKLAEIEGILAEIAKKEAAEKAKEAKYQGLIIVADGLLENKDYEGAKGKYNEALGVKSEEQYPKDKIKEIENLLAEIARKKAEAEAAKMAAGERDAKYEKTIALADAAFGSKNYEGAKGKYNEALGIKSEEQYPKDRLTEIEGLLAEIASKKAAENAANLAASEKEEKYNQAIKLADKAMTAKSYKTAKGKYNEALGIKSGEQYPKDKLAEIEVALANLAAQNAKDVANQVKLAKEEQYNQTIKLADKALSDKNYQAAKGKYNEALGIKSGEQYPKDKLAEIEVALANLATQSAEDALAAESERKKREYFNALIAEADGELVSKNYDAAKSKYNQALLVIPGEQYPTDKLKEIANLLANLKANEKNAALAQKQLEENYKKIIAQADASFSAKNYNSAKPKYKEALSLKSGEAYPRDQIAEIDRLLAEIAERESKITLKNNALKQKEQAYANFIRNADEQLAGKQYRSALSNYKQAIEIKSGEQYPKDKVNDINKILADLAAKERANSANAQAEQEKRKRYDKIIYNADRAFKLKDYDKAKSEYNSALGIYSNEQYPKDRLSEIEARLNEKPKEEIIVKKNNNWNRAGIDDENEREIEKRMAMLLAGSNAARGKRLEKDKADYNHQETIRVSGGVERTIGASKEFEKYTEQEREFIKKQEELNVDKSEAHYVYVDNLEEANIIMRERGEELRASNRKEVEEITADSEKSKRISKKKRKEKEIDILELKSNVAKEEEIRLRASLGRRTDNENDIKRLAEEMTNMKAEKIDSYKENVVELTAFKEDLNTTESERLKRASGERQVNKKDRERVYDESRKDAKKQEKKYYKDAQKVAEYREVVDKQDVVYQKGANERRELSNKELVIAKGKLGETTEEQKKRYETFHTKLKEEQEQNNNFLSDLKTVERNKILVANAGLNDVYRGEKQASENKELASKYSQGITEETIESGSSVVIKRTKVTGNHVDVYERVFYKWGGSYFLKNGKNITKSLWDKESIE